MFKIALILICFFVNLSNLLANNADNGKFKPINKEYQTKIVNAIFLAEGGNNTKYPYGIKSIKTNNPRRVCENTVANNYIRWQAAGKTNSFIQFLGARYCPMNDKADKNGLNKNWVKNVVALSNN